MRKGTIKFLDNVVKIYQDDGTIDLVLKTAKAARRLMNGPDCTDADREHQDLFIRKLEEAN